MIDRTTKLRWRRRIKHSQQHVESFGVHAEKHIEKHFFRRLNRLVGVRRFVIGWFMLFVLLIGGVVAQNQALFGFYQDIGPVSGGNYTEGILGSFTNANPLYATGAVDASVARLVFSSLLQYDSNNKLVGDLAARYSVNETLDTYTVHLRKDVQWHDGVFLTAHDVVFTYKSIKDPDAKSPLLANWEGVQISAPNDYTVVFKLPHGLTSFPHSLTNGILPKHLLDDIPSSQLRSIAFNTNPVGSGPFKWQTVQVSGSTPETREEQVQLVRNDNYYDGAAKLDSMLLRAFHSEDSMIESLAKHELDGLVGLSSPPTSVAPGIIKHVHSVPLMGEIMVFLKNTSPILESKQVRQALTHATNANKITKQLAYPVIRADSLLLRSHLGYTSEYKQLAFNPKQASKLLSQAGWGKKNKEGIRVRGGKTLSFRLFSKSSSQYALVASELQKQWRRIGVNLQVVLQPDEDLESTIAFHNYDALLYGITLGSDPDIYAYWHSSQADARSSSRLNFAEYKSDIVDQALEGGRNRAQPKVRALKYRPMLKAWREDAPAIALYQPPVLYITATKLYGFEPTKFNAPIDRYANVVNWAIREARVTTD